MMKLEDESVELVGQFEFEFLRVSTTHVELEHDEQFEVAICATWQPVSCLFHASSSEA